MESIDQENVHPVKRRRIDITPTNDLVQLNSQTYLTLAHMSVQVDVAHLEKRSTSNAVLSNPVVSITSISSSDSKISIQLSAPWLKPGATLLTKHNREIEMILEDCAMLESTSKATDSTNAPLACHDAKLYLGEDSARLMIKILWHNTSEARDRINPPLRKILTRYDNMWKGSVGSSTPEPWNVREFYDHVHVPDTSTSGDTSLQVDLLHCQLYPFQKRAVKWLLSREGVDVQASGQVTAHCDTSQCTQLPPGFHEAKDANGSVYYSNPTIGVACNSMTSVSRRYSTLRGGLLGEAMGLGKTVEVIALMCLHKMDNSPIRDLKPTHLRRTGATLIITPPTILEQWRQEIQEHAPSLRVYHYQGVKSSSKMARKTVMDDLCNQDVVLTTYNTIAKELHYVMEKPDRALRDRPRAEPPKSPLDQILWWRVCLDEAQMIESGVSAAATVARLIPRVNAWAVTGTPLKQSHKDLYGLLLFLRYEPWCNSLRLWEYLIHYHRPLFRSLMGTIAIRHSKEVVRDELRLPPQSRHTITIAFSNIEQAHYAQLFYDMYHDCGLNRDGSPTDEQWDPDSPKTIEKMRTWLTRLRQTCVHPEVGGRNKRALGRNHGPLRTVAQVLDVMIEQTESMLRTEQRNMLIHKVRQGQIFENAKSQEEALKIYTQSYDEAKSIVEQCRSAWEVELAQQTVSDDTKEHDKKEEDEESDVEDVESPLNAARQRLRSALEIKHLCIFFMANIYFQMKSDEEKVAPDSDEYVALEKKEVVAYEEAKRIRAELLQEVVRKANRKIVGIRSQEGNRELVKIPEMKLDLEYMGIESRKIFEKLYKFCGAMNAQAEQLCELREKMVKFLQSALIDEDEGVELQGDEYENSTKHQDEMYAYMEALRALYADRSDAITGLENLLIRSEMKGFLKAAKEKEGPAPELMIELLQARETKRIRISEQGSLRGIVGELRALVTSLQWSEAAGHSSRPKAEMHVAEQILQHATQLMAAQNKAMAGLEQEVAHFRNSMNARLEYYKALQKISDTVAPYREEDIGKPLDQAQLLRSVREETSARNKCSNMLAKSRYLLHLKNESTSDSAERVCTICQSEFETGTITSCGHVFCKEDIQLWYAQHGNCPVCKRRLRAADFFDITYKPSEMVVQVEDAVSPGSPHSANDRPAVSNSIYSDISTKQLNEIKNVEIRGASFGSKVDTICRHLHWLRDKDAGSKTIIFSQFREVLDVLGKSFRQNGILYSKCDDKGAVEDFKSNPAIEVFLLHARAHSAGLNLVVASHVILCEPLINTALELQAIARVHRIGQQRATTVWMYLIADTVEESIYDISVKRRLSHMKSKNVPSRSGTQTPVLLPESAIDAANSKELQAADLSKALAPGRNGGELVDKEDLWPSLFSNFTSKGVGSGTLGVSVDTMEADSEVGRFLRAEAAERRM